ncbi:MAG: type II CRISPR RNA-guided endonuclease Cas9 [Gammaproteobacteria bacterium WSBS_2016_MAG_OTU1]
MAKTRLGIDMGTNSIGWMLYELDKNGEISEVLKAGVRIFPDGREDKTQASKNAARRVARMNRRQRDRYLQRRTAILRYLVKFGLMPEDKIEQRKLQDVDPYSIRAKAMEEEIPPHHLGRAIFHISQRRGYKSSRRNEENDKDGPVKSSIEEFRRQLGDKSVGQFLSELHQENKPIRARRDGVTNNDLFHYFPDRELIEKEFNDIWQKQQQIRSQQPDKNKQILSDILTNENKQTLFEVIFHQRSLKPPIIGNCQFFPTKKRIAKALPSFQRFRILQDINNLKYFDENEWHHLSPSIRDWALRILFAGGNLTFKKLNSQMKKDGEINESAFFNLDDEKRDDIKGDFTTKTMKKIIPAWDEWDLHKQDSMISLLIGYEIIDEDKLLDELSSRYNLSNEEAQECANANIDNRQGVSGRASLSLKAISILMPYLEKGKHHDKALAESEIEKDKSSKHDDHFYMQPYPEILGQWCLPRKSEDESNKELWRIPNPTVHVALNQLRAVVNDCIRINGGEKPSQVVVELARDLPIGIATRQEIRKKQLENQSARTTLPPIKIEAGSMRVLNLCCASGVGRIVSQKCQ